MPLSRAEALYARVAIARAEVVEIAEALCKVADATYGDLAPERARECRKSINAQAMLACAELDSLRDTAFRLARAAE